MRGGRMLANLLREPSLSDIDVDTGDRLLAHRRVIERKPMIRDVFAEIQGIMWSLSQQKLSGTGIDVEIGSGVYPMKTNYPSVIATDVVPAPILDRVLDAQSMDLGAATVRTVFGQHCFHHLPEPRKFLAELRRVLVPGGGAVLVEPYWSPAASLMFKHLFREEGFDKTAPAWETDVGGAMSGANQALSYIIFERDRTRYDAQFPDLPIVHQTPLGNYLRYLLSGGLNFRQLVPGAAASALRLIERVLVPLNRHIALHHVVVIQKR